MGQGAWGAENKSFLKKFSSAMQVVLFERVFEAGNLPAKTFKFG